MYCLNCGREIDDKALNCPYCGTLTENAQAAPAYSNVKPKVQSSTLAIVSIVIGSIGILMAWLIALLGYIFGGTALTFALVSHNKVPEDRKWLTGLILSCITLISAIINSILGMLLMM